MARMVPAFFTMDCLVSSSLRSVNISREAPWQPCHQYTRIPAQWHIFDMSGKCSNAVNEISRRVINPGQQIIH